MKYIARIMLVMLALAVLVGCGKKVETGSFECPEEFQLADISQFKFPKVNPAHKHMNMLLANAIRYVDPKNELVDPVSGYLYEGWNHDPEKGFFLRSFTQLTSIGEGLEVMANVAAGYADNPYLSREQALENLALVAKSLRHDQKDPSVGAKGLLGNFLGLEDWGRLGPLTSTVTKKEFVEAFGEEKAGEIWQALANKKWIELMKDGNLASIKRGDNFGTQFFANTYASRADDETISDVVGIFGRRLVTEEEFADVLGEKGSDIWSALAEKDLVVLKKDKDLVPVKKWEDFDSKYFDNSLEPFADDETIEKVMTISGRRVVMIIFGDNANLSASVAKAIGALLSPGLKDDPKAKKIRDELEAFLDAQQEGYEYLVDHKTGTIIFGWDATADEWVGWGMGDNWTVGHNDYFINEFRGPSMFVHLRYGTPVNTLRNAGFKVKRYELMNKEDTYSLASWDGSAFQVLGLSLFMDELKNPGWKALLENAVDVEVDFSTKNKLPGFLSESYTGDKRQYTGEVGIPSIAATTSHRITNAPSLYTLGIAYMVAPEKMEKFLADNWSIISTLLTDHGPWEGYNVTFKKKIEYQTSAHTLSFVLGAIGSAPENMMRYLEYKGLKASLDKLYAPGEKVDFLSKDTQLVTWTGGGESVEVSKQEGVCTVKGKQLKDGGINFVVPQEKGVKMSSGTLIISYRSTVLMDPVIIEFNRTKGDGMGRPNEIYTRFKNTAGKEKTIEIPLPATPGLNGLKELVVSYRSENRFDMDLTFTGFKFKPNSGAWIATKSTCCPGH